MAREFDSRSEIETPKVAASFAELQAQAAEISQDLPGDQEVVVKSMDPATGYAVTVASKGAEPGGTNLVDAALGYVHSIKPVLGLTAHESLGFRSDENVLETSSGASAVHLQQTMDDIAVFQAGQTVRFTHDNAIEASSGRAAEPAAIADPTPELTVEQAVLAAARNLAEPDDTETRIDQFGEQSIEAPVDLGELKPSVRSSGDDAERHTTLSAPPLQDPVTANLTWFDLDNYLHLGWSVVLGLPDGGDHYRVIVDAHSGDVLYSHRLTVRVVGRGDVFLPDGGSPRQLHDFPLALNSYPFPTPAGLPSPFPRSDWVAVDQTEGNNVRAHLNGGGTAAGSTVGGVMTFDPTNATGDDQLRVNLFFFCNFMHDFLYLLGFREADGNFQNDNGTQGGAASDRVDAFVYPAAVQGTANMYTPVDGSSPTMNMGLVTSTNRHTALDSSVVFHEYTHGLSNRLVGGRVNAHALDAVQSGGMGEGWSDYVACTINNTVVLGTWILNNTTGIRGFPYDAAFPDHFGKLGTGRYDGSDVHNIGEIWCAALMELNRKIGKNLAIQVVVDGLKLTPANPTFLQARDGIISALENKARAEHWSANRRRLRVHQAWRAFARFGMGYRAKSGPSTGFTGIVADFTTPRLSVRAGDIDGDGHAEALVSSPWGVGVWKLSGSSMTAPMMAPNGTRFGQWLLNTADNSIAPLADFDGDGHAEVLVSSPWGVGVWKLTGASMNAAMMAPNGTRFGQWLLNTADNEIGPVGDFDGDGHTETLVSSPWGVGVWKLNGAAMTAPMMAPNGTRFGQWLLNTVDNEIGPVGDFDGDGHDEVLVSSPWGVGVWKLSGSSMTAPMMAPNGTRFGEWLLNSADNSLGPVGDFDGDGHDEILVSSPWGIGVWKLNGSSMSVVMMAPNGTRFGQWWLNTADNHFGPVGDFDGDGHDEILVSSPWGVGIWKLPGSSMTAPMMAPNGTRFGQWLLNTVDNDLGVTT